MDSSIKILSAESQSHEMSVIHFEYKGDAMFVYVQWKDRFPLGDREDFPYIMNHSSYAVELAIDRESLIRCDLFYKRDFPFNRELFLERIGGMSTLGLILDLDLACREL